MSIYILGKQVTSKYIKLPKSSSWYTGGRFFRRMRRRVEVAKNFLGLSMQAEQDIFLSENSDLLYLGHLAKYCWFQQMEFHFHLQCRNSRCLSKHTRAGLKHVLCQNLCFGV